MAAAAAAAAATHDAEGRLTRPGLISKLTEIMGIGEADADSLITSLNVTVMAPLGTWRTAFMKIPEEPLNVGTVNEIASGAYGRVYAYKNATRQQVVKEVFKINQPTDVQVTKESNYRDFFTEVIIQIILSSDQALGQHIPAVLRVRRNGDNVAYVTMRKINGSTLANRLIGAAGPITFAVFKDTTLSFARIMADLNRKYGFVHFDFKPGNLGIDAVHGPQIIDFGASCLNFAGMKFRSQSFLYVNRATATCNPAADFGLYFAMLRSWYFDKLDDESQAFVIQMLTSAGMANVTKETYEKAYNFDGTTYNTYPRLRPENVIAAFDEWGGAGLAGGRRRRRRRTQKRKSHRR